MAVIAKSEDAIANSEHCKNDITKNYYDIKTIIKRKVIFSEMPKPIIANVPKSM